MMYTKEDLQKAKELIENTENILVTSHYGPDGDAISSVLAVYNLLKQKEKKVSVIIEDKIPEKYQGFQNYEVLKEGNVLDFLKKNKCDLLIVCDASELSRISLNEQDELEIFVKENSMKTLCIDHHLVSERTYKFDFLINWNYSSAAETIYELFVEKLNYKIDKELADILMVGLLSDTNRFLYGTAETYPKSFEIAAKLVALGVNIDQLISKLDRFFLSSTIIISEMLRNIQVTDKYTYSFLSDDFSSSTQYVNTPSDERKSANNYFVDNFIRNMNDNMWGFTVYKDLRLSGHYKGSFRSVRGVVDTTVFATKLGGGGHKPASGFRFPAKNLDEALNKIQKVIKENIQEAMENA